MVWKIFLSQLIASCPACLICAGVIPSGSGDLYSLKLGLDLLMLRLIVGNLI